MRLAILGDKAADIRALLDNAGLDYEEVDLTVERVQPPRVVLLGGFGGMIGLSLMTGCGNLLHYDVGLVLDLNIDPTELVWYTLPTSPTAPALGDGPPLAHTCGVCKPWCGTTQVIHPHLR